MTTLPITARQELAPPLEGDTPYQLLGCTHIAQKTFLTMPYLSSRYYTRGKKK